MLLSIHLIFPEAFGDKPNGDLEHRHHRRPFHRLNLSLSLGRHDSPCPRQSRRRGGSSSSSRSSCFLRQRIRNIHSGSGGGGGGGRGRVGSRSGGGSKTAAQQVITTGENPKTSRVWGSPR